MISKSFFFDLYPRHTLAIRNTIILGGGSKISGSVYGGGGESGIGGRYDYNKLVISGAGNTIGGSKIKNLPYIVFDASNVANGNSMLNLTDNNCSWNSETVDVINPSLAVGEKITLISITDNTFDGLGDALLVCPMLEENAKQREVYLPAGNWIGLFDKKEYKGDSRIIVNMNDKIPVFVNKDADIKQLELIEDYD